MSSKTLGEMAQNYKEISEFDVYEAICGALKFSHKHKTEPLIYLTPEQIDSILIELGFKAEKPTVITTDEEYHEEKS